MNPAIGFGHHRKALTGSLCEGFVKYILSLPMKKSIALALLIPALLGPIAAITTTADSSIAAKPTKQPKRQTFGPWSVTLQEVSSAGRTIRSPYEHDEGKQLQAAGQWVVARVRIQNNTSSRQSAKNVFYLNGAKIIDQNGRARELDNDASNWMSMDELIESKPFNPGESRDVILTFDMQSNARIQRLEIPVKGSSADLKVNFAN